MLKTRVLTALVMAAIGLAVLFGLPPTAFALVAGVLLLGLGGWEAAALSGLPGRSSRLAMAAGLLIAAALSTRLFASEHIVFWLLPGVLTWLLLLAWLTRPQLGRQGWVAAKLLILSIVLLSAWLALCWLQARSPWLVLLVVLIIAAADIGAYFTGRAVGGPKLAPSISPGKTRSGAAGGLVAATLLGAAAMPVLPDMPFSPPVAAAIGLLLAAVSIGGDLFMSLLKRQVGLKDSSRLLPGHGGILDRFDSLGAALPCFAMILALLAR